MNFTTGILIFGKTLLFELKFSNYVAIRINANIYSDSSWGRWNVMMKNVQ
jgi:hypothetical protein